MFGMGTQEILIILVVALIFIGPKKLPQIARALGKGFGELRRAADELKGEIDFDMMENGEDETKREAAHQDLDSPHDAARPFADSSSHEAESPSPAHEQPDETTSEKTETGREDPVP